jgi:hypothetical protein
MRANAKRRWADHKVTVQVAFFGSNDSRARFGSSWACRSSIVGECAALLRKRKFWKRPFAL